MKNKKIVILSLVVIALATLVYSQLDKIKNSSLYLKMTTGNEYGIREEDLIAINESGYNDRAKTLLIKVAQDVRDISNNYQNEEWINKNASSIYMSLACGTLAELEQNNKVIKVFKVFVNTNERMTANQIFWVNYDRNHGSKPYPTKEECDSLKL